MEYTTTKAVYWVSADKQRSICLALSDDDVSDDALILDARSESESIGLVLGDGDTFELVMQSGDALDGVLMDVLYTESAIC